MTRTLLFLLLLIVPVTRARHERILRLLVSSLFLAAADVEIYQHLGALADAFRDFRQHAVGGAGLYGVGLEGVAL